MWDRRWLNKVLRNVMIKKEFRPLFQEAGRVGGRRAAENMTPEARAERARRAALARWAKAKRKGT